MEDRLQNPVVVPVSHDAKQQARTGRMRTSRQMGHSGGRLSSALMDFSDDWSSKPNSMVLSSGVPSVTRCRGDTRVSNGSGCRESCEGDGDAEREPRPPAPWRTGTGAENGARGSRRQHNDAQACIAPQRATRRRVMQQLPHPSAASAGSPARAWYIARRTRCRPLMRVRPYSVRLADGKEGEGHTSAFSWRRWQFFTPRLQP